MKRIILLSAVLLSLHSHAVTIDSTHDDPVCEKMLQAINANDGNALAQLALIEKTQDELCFKGDANAVAKKLSNALLRAEAEKLYAIAIPAGEIARFDTSQRTRLQPYKQHINALMKYVGSKRRQWLLSTLYFVLHPVSKDERLVWTDKLLNGYLDDATNGYLNQHMVKSGFDNFLNDIHQYHVVDAVGNNRSVAFRQQRAAEDSAQVRYVKYRSTLAPTVMKTIIDFKYDSVTPTVEGEKEYQKALDVAKANTTRQLVIVGHASPKGSRQYNCELSKKRAYAIRDSILADTHLRIDNIKVAWAGENIPLDFGQAKAFLSRDIQVLDDDNVDDPRRRRVEFQINGETLLKKYAGKLCGSD